MKSESATSLEVGSFFDSHAGDFDAIYSGRTNFLMRAMNRVFRHDMYLRYELTINECGSVNGRRVLDVGCGSGRYSHELAARGAESVGLDLAPNMIALAREISARRGVTDKTTFVETEYTSFAVKQPFDITLAIGYFDYISDPLVHLRKMRSDTSGMLIVTFPVARTIRSHIRNTRLRLRGCPVFFYTLEQVHGLIAQSGWKTRRIERIGQLHWVAALRASR